MLQTLVAKEALMNKVIRRKINNGTKDTVFKCYVYL